MVQLAVATPLSEPIEDGLRISFQYHAPTVGDFHIGLAAVIEELDGTKSYWALAHPPGAPDFHHADCFALTLPAIGGS